MNGLHDPLQQSNGRMAEREAAQGGELTIQSEVARLTTLKDDLTSRLETYYTILRTNESTLSTPLVDPEGFPRSDIDVAGVRTARVQIIRLRNDLRDCLAEMGRLVERGLPRGQSDVMEVEVEERREVGGEGGFARVDSVAKDSPAENAGLKKDDKLISIGGINSTNHDNLRAVGALVSSNEGVALPVIISRPSTTSGAGRKQVLHLRLTPNKWSGRGLLGCHIFLL